MVEYQDDGVFPAPPDQVWRLLRAHLDPARITAIHPLAKSQTVLRQDRDVTLVRRMIDVRGKLLPSEWKVTSRPPEMSRWDITASEGPWSVGSWIENHYSEALGGTRIVTRGDLKVKVLPFILPQRPFIRRIFSDIDREDVAYLPRLGP
ncbi:MAG: SRPBCC family protein [Thermoplasmata archaeon]